MGQRRTPVSSLTRAHLVSVGMVPKALNQHGIIPVLTSSCLS